MNNQSKDKNFSKIIEEFIAKHKNKNAESHLENITDVNELLLKYLDEKNKNYNDDKVDNEIGTSIDSLVKNDDLSDDLKKKIKVGIMDIVDKKYKNPFIVENKKISDDIGGEYNSIEVKARKLLETKSPLLFKQADFFSLWPGIVQLLQQVIFENDDKSIIKEQESNNVEKKILPTDSFWVGDEEDKNVIDIKKQYGYK